MNDKNTKKVWPLIGTTMIILLVLQCAGPIYFNKELKKTVKPVVYMVPSSYFGSFLVHFSKSEETWKAVPFNTWEQFDGDVNLAIRNSFTKHGFKTVLLDDQQVGEGLNALIVNDTIKNNFKQYTTLESVYGSDYDTLTKGMEPGLLLVCTKYELKRVFPNIEARARYYVYSIADGGLMLVNIFEKKYIMKSQAMDALMDFDKADFEEKLEQRLYGLWPEEKDSYKKICQLFSDKLISTMLKQCLDK